MNQPLVTLNFGCINREWIAVPYDFPSLPRYLPFSALYLKESSLTVLGPSDYHASASSCRAIREQSAEPVGDRPDCNVCNRSLLADPPADSSARADSSLRTHHPPG